MALQTNFLGDEKSGWLMEVAAMAGSELLYASPARSDVWDYLDRCPVAILMAEDRECLKITGNRAATYLLNVPGRMDALPSLDPHMCPARILCEGAEVSANDLLLRICASSKPSATLLECEVHLPDGQVLAVAGHIIPLTDENGAPAGGIGAFIEVSPLQRRFDKASVISREMSHRVKNNTALIMAISQMTLKEFVPASVYHDFEGRLQSLAHLSERGYSANWKEVDFVDLVSDTTLRIVGKAKSRVILDGPNIALDPAVGQSLALILHEWTTNACKYGALSINAGQVTLQWEDQYDGEGRVLIKGVWQESGGPRPSVQPVSGFGTRLIETLFNQLPGGKVSQTYAATGFGAKFEFVIER